VKTPVKAFFSAALDNFLNSTVVDRGPPPAGHGGHGLE
jgi:hypothetical protein